MILMKEKNIPGLSISVSTKDKVIWSQGFGFSDLENKIPVKINSKFRIGSVSKTLTTLAIGKLLENNRLKLSDNIRDFVPYFPAKAYTISVRELANHTSGIRAYNNGEYLSYKNYESVKKSIDVFKEDSLAFKPNTKYLYSTYGYVLLSAVIEGATSMNFTDYMRDSIFVPLNLKNTLPDNPYEIIDNRVRFYDKVDGAIINSPAVDNSNKWAGGGYLSTPFDLVTICRSLMNNTFLKESTKQKLWTPNTLDDGQHTDYGLGWRMDKDNFNRYFVHHGGSSVGGRSFLLAYPNDGICIALTSNLSDSFDQSFVLKLAGLFLNK